LIGIKGFWDFGIGGELLGLKGHERMEKDMRDYLDIDLKGLGTRFWIGLESIGSWTFNFDKDFLFGPILDKDKVGPDLIVDWNKNQLANWIRIDKRKLQAINLDELVPLGSNRNELIWVV